MWTPGYTDGLKGKGILTLRVICQFVDRFIYFILDLIFKIFFDLCKLEMKDNTIVNTLIHNVELLLSLFIVFRISIAILNYIVDPDKIKDSKVGAKKLILNIMLVLVLITSLIPMSGIPESSDHENVNGKDVRTYNYYLRNYGILFGTLQLVQESVINQNIIPKIILGRGEEYTSDVDKQSGQLISIILRSFVYPATNPDDPSKALCTPNGGDAIYITHNDTDDYSLIINRDIMKKCDDEVMGTDGERHDYYAFNYIPLGSMICGVILIFVVAGFCVDIAIRYIKLVLLRIIAPIPIISLLSPGKSSAFESWLKLTIKTFLDLFLRIAIIVFIVDLCLIIDESIDAKSSFLTKIFVYIGLFVFAKQAPKFFMDMFDIKSDGSLFGNIGTLAGVGALAGGMIGSGVTGWRAASKENADLKDNNKLRYYGRNAGSAILGSLGGGYAGAKGLHNSKDGNSIGSVMDNISKHNQDRANHKTFLRSTGQDLRALFSGQTAYEAQQANWDAEEERIKNDELALKHQQDINAHRKSIMDRAKSKAVDSTYTTGSFIDSKGNKISGNYRAYHSAYTAAMNQGVGVHDDGRGNKYFEFNGQRVSLAEAQSIDLGLLDDNAKDYYAKAYADRNNQGSTSYRDASISADIDAFNDLSGTTIEDNFGSLKASFGTASAANSSASDELNSRRQILNNDKTSMQSSINKNNSNRSK